MADPTVDIDGDAARELARHELSKPIYPRRSLWDHVLSWINDRLDRLLAHGASMPGGWLTVLVLAVVVIVAALLIVRLVRRTIRTQPGETYQLFDGAELTAAQHRAAAADYAARGDWAGAIRHRLRAVARHLEETGVLTAVPGRTATELTRAAAVAYPALSGEFTSAAAIFNDVTYGEQPGTAEEYQQIADLDEHLCAQRGTPSGTAATVEGWTAVR
ncbi:membrane protein [Mycolicibacterium insubricum]|uniref:Protein-glutamine gamma-glutamyltransferase-like C-terminal domain-containing protein n=1 Tax=Mycolicibacterium insubricum TaxID=444597 RepID=A0A1X0CVV5_9MYCO|nr:DUF4129 domain-containing protein [Mycolicibacterium insubricum]MCB9439180.1 DUF4129 domain-containing protein [Mycolicibacterium sp.]ORA64326.1 hypothetical protein BST26_19865 [Mycolicibacterium insubricum]BBZ64849.1 membrane protein [Mycolicibacterium insubricum]